VGDKRQGERSAEEFYDFSSTQFQTLVGPQRT
jgi:hypothetical protein